MVLVMVVVVEDINQDEFDQKKVVCANTDHDNVGGETSFTFISS